MTLSKIASVSFRCPTQDSLRENRCADENSDTGQESKGQGIANIATGFLGGMAGCAMIGQSMINFKIVTGELFFASTSELVHAFDYFEETPNVIIDLTDAHIGDSSAVAVLDTIVAKFARHGTAAEIIGLNHQSTEIHNRLSGHLAARH